MEVDFSARVAAYQSARERLELLKDGVPNRQNFLKVCVALYYCILPALTALWV